MRRFRLSTLMLLIVIAALGITVVMQQVRAARREAKLRDAMAQIRPLRQFPTSNEEIWESFLKQYREEADRRAELAKQAEAQQKPK